MDTSDTKLLECVEWYDKLWNVSACKNINHLVHALKMCTKDTF